MVRTEVFRAQTPFICMGSLQYFDVFTYGTSMNILCRCLGLYPRDSLSVPMFPGLFLLVSVRQPLKHREFSHYPGLSYIFN